MLHTVVSFLLHHLVVALTLSAGLAASPHELGDLRRRFPLYLRMLVGVVIAVPLVAIGVVASFDLRSVAAATILTMAICPGAPFIVLATKKRGQPHSPLGLNILVLTSLFAPLVVPFWAVVVRRVLPFELRISAELVAGQLVSTVLAPLFLGLALRYVLPSAAELLARVVHAFFLVALAVAVVGGLYVGAPALLHVRPNAFAAALLVIVAAALVGYWAGAPYPGDRRATAVATVLGNPGLALAVIAASYPGFETAAIGCAYVLFRKLVLVPIELWIDRHTHPPPGAAARAVEAR